MSLAEGLTSETRPSNVTDTEHAVLAIGDHLARILATVAPLAARPTPLSAALGRVLAEPVVAGTYLPRFDNSAMDGYAVRRRDVEGASFESPVRLRVTGEMAAGSAADLRVDVGCAVRLMTGAPVPPGADAIVPIEHTEGGARGWPSDKLAEVSVTVAPAAGAYIRRAGSDVSAGDGLLRAGTPLSPRALATAASAGRAEVRVHPAPRVAVLSTGDELVAPGTPPGPGQIPDTNTLLLAACVTEAGGLPIALAPIRDDEDTLRNLLREVAPDVDAFLLSGGVSAGAYDVGKAVLAPLPTMRFDHVRMQPGKPQGFGQWTDGTPVFALPGNPVSAYVSFEVFVRPALRRMQGLAELHRDVVRLPAAVGWSSPAGKRQYLPAVATHAQGSARGVRPAARGGSGSHLVASLAQANALAVVPEDVTEVRPGDLIGTMDLA